MTETETKTETDIDISADIDISVGGWATASGATDVSIVLDPEHMQVYSFNTIGSGTPMSVWHRRHLVIGHVPITADPDSLLAALRAQEERIRVIAGCYRGTRWDGNNHVGSWDLFADWTGEDLVDLSEVATYADAGEWLFAAAEDIVRELLAGSESIDDYATRTEHDASQVGVLLDHADTVRALVRLLDRAADRLDLADDDDRATARRIVALLTEEDPTIAGRLRRAMSVSITTDAVSALVDADTVDSACAQFARDEGFRAEGLDDLAEAVESVGGSLRVRVGDDVIYRSESRD